MTQSLNRLKDTFASFSAGQKAVAVVGTLALLLAGFMVFRWAATPSYSPLFSNMSAEDASAVIDELEATGVPYEISNGGATVMVPQEQVHETRIALSGEGLPASNDGGYSLLDEQSLSTSQFQEQTSFKRAMEGELATTIEAIDGVRTAVVRLALPPKQVFAKEQDPATASVLVATDPGDTFAPEQVQAVVHLVASSIDGLAPEKVTVADSTGRLLSADDATSGTGAGTRAQAVEEYQDDLSAKIQRTLDTVIGPGNSTVALSANLDFDKSVSTSTTYQSDPAAKPLSRSRQRETYNGGAAGNAGAGGPVGPEGQMEQQPGNGEGAYNKETTTEDNAVNQVVETREAAPGGVESLHIGIALDANAPVKVSAGDVRDLIAAAIGEDLDRGDTIEVATLAFDRSAEEAAQQELEAAAAADAKAARNEMLRNGGLGALVALMLLLAWLKGRKRAKARAEATTYVVEQLRLDQATRAQQPVMETSAAMVALESAERNEADDLREELTALVERQPEDVAQLLRGWLVERP
ncbi:flagellar basal-body MS-ring/collar protein FliF [Nocardioides campestrisoli]|uniref:flagellar basal-body MS-ring/collar protein FliF n=1 Tax=Nocardioides campestrisoli TaxID=2736757 RepID=UPI001CD574D1|nr:flagellar basal-body MS-ring/collar protein FliF [Nocardioides campestrisoli]